MTSRLRCACLRQTKFKFQNHIHSYAQKQNYDACPVSIMTYFSHSVNTHRRSPLCVNTSTPTDFLRKQTRFMRFVSTREFFSNNPNRSDTFVAHCRAPKIAAVPFFLVAYFGCPPYFLHVLACNCVLTSLTLCSIHFCFTHYSALLHRVIDNVSSVFLFFFWLLASKQYTGSRSSGLLICTWIARSIDQE